MLAPLGALGLCSMEPWPSPRSWAMRHTVLSPLRPRVFALGEGPQQEGGRTRKDFQLWAPETGPLPPSLSRLPGAPPDSKAPAGRAAWGSRLTAAHLLNGESGRQAAAHSAPRPAPWGARPRLRWGEAGRGRQVVAVGELGRGAGPSPSSRARPERVPWSLLLSWGRGWPCVEGG